MFLMSLQQLAASQRMNHCLNISYTSPENPIARIKIPSKSLKQLAAINLEQQAAWSLAYSTLHPFESGIASLTT